MDTSEPTKRLLTRLRQWGYNVSDTDAGITVRLPMFCSIRIFHNGNALEFEPRFGWVRRSTATWFLMCITFLAVVILLFLPGSVELPALAKEVWPPTRAFVVVFLVIAHIWDVYRYLLTEHFITRVRHLSDGGDSAA